MLITSAFIAALVYALTYAPWGIDPGRTKLLFPLAGWAADILFAPSLALLLPTFVAIAPDGRLFNSRPWRGILWVSAAASSLLLLAGGLFEPHLVLTPNAMTPGPLANLLGPHRMEIAIGLVMTGWAAFAVAMFSAISGVVLRLRTATDQEWIELRWLFLAGILSLAALLPSAPYLLVSALHGAKPAGPTSDHLAALRAFGAVVAAAVPIAVLASFRKADWPWPSRLVRGAIVAGLVSLMHESIVLGISRPLVGEYRAAAVEWSLTLLIALGVEPLTEHARRFFDRWFPDRTPHGLLSEAGTRLRMSTDLLEIAAERARGWVSRIEAEASRNTVKQRLADAPHLDRRRSEFSESLRGIRRDHCSAGSLILNLEARIDELEAVLEREGRRPAARVHVSTISGLQSPSP